MEIPLWAAPLLGVVLVVGGMRLAAWSAGQWEQPRGSSYPRRMVFRRVGGMTPTVCVVLCAGGIALLLETARRLGLVGAFAVWQYAAVLVVSIALVVVATWWPRFALRGGQRDDGDVG